MTGERFRKLALSLPEAREAAHMNHPDFRVGGRIFATLSGQDEGLGMVKLTSEQQAEFIRAEPKVFLPCNGAWGRQGSTHVKLAAAKESGVRRALLAAWRNTAPRELANPAKAASDQDARLERLSKICLGFPEVTRELSGGHATFRVRGKPFVYFLNDHHGDGRVALCWKAAPGENAEWVKYDPVRFHLPAYLGPRGWAGLRLDVGRPVWSEVSGFVRDSYRRTAPKRLSAELPRPSRRRKSKPR